MCQMSHKCKKTVVIRMNKSLLSAAEAATLPAKFLDASYGVPAYPASVLAGMERGRVTGAQHFDIDAVADPHSPYPHTMPDEATFGVAVGALGISNDDAVVVYDQNGISFAAARAWWMFRAFGHQKVYVLNGGLNAWRAAGLPLQSGPLEPPAPARFVATFRPELFCDFDAMEAGGMTVLDARNAARFSATVHTIDGDAVPAHMEGSHNVPFQDLLDFTGAMKPTEDLKPLLEPYLKAERLTCTCGSGVTACVLAMALHELGRSDVAVYDGSWTEWADRQDLR